MLSTGTSLAAFSSSFRRFVRTGLAWSLFKGVRPTIRMK